jgi:CDP-Glycerol:Poly(glycerophosphate) glycerophosphotransferase
MMDMLATEPHLVDHLSPVWAALPPAARGRFLVPDALRGRAAERGIDRLTAPVASGTPILVASYGDLKRVRKLGRTRIALAQHGAGQSYRGVTHGSYPGGRDNADVSLFLVPNEQAAGRWRERYPAARVEVVGCPKLETLPAREAADVPPTVAFAFHCAAAVCPESGTAFGWNGLQRAILQLTDRYRVIGHAHPRIARMLSRWYARHGIEVTEDFDDVCRRADVLVFDNTSAGFEFAATGRPVVVLSPPT